MQEPQQSSQFPQSPPITPQPQAVKTRSNDGPGYFYYIAGISLVNSILFIFNFGFYGSLAVTTIITSIAIYIADSVRGDFTTNLLINGVAFVINAVIAGIVAGFGYLSGRGHSWVYVVGMVAYTIDTLLMMWLGDWLEVLVHLYFLFMLWRGWSQLRKLNKAIAYSQDNSPSVID